MQGAGKGPGEGQAQRLADLGARVVEVTHELKVPLSLIVGSLEQLSSNVRIAVEQAGGREPPADDLTRALETAAALLHICRYGAERLERVVDLVSEYGRLEPREEPAGGVRVEPLLRATAALVTRTAVGSPAIVLDLPDVPPVRGHEDTLSRVFVNLLRNAVEAVGEMPDASIRITARSHHGDSPHVEVRVRDNGPGIPLTDRDHVFEPFFTRKRAGGLGLGLAIVREAVEASGGTVVLAPDRMSGTEFVITLPLAR